VVELKREELAGVIKREASLVGRIPVPSDQSRWIEALSARCAGDNPALARDLRLKSLSLAPSRELCSRLAARWLSAADGKRRRTGARRRGTAPMTSR